MNIITARKASRNKIRVVALDGELVAPKRPQDFFKATGLDKF
jgi:hypothetical protein